MFVEIIGDPGGEVRELIGGASLMLQDGGKLALIAGPFDKDHQMARNQRGGAGAKIFLDQGQRHIDARRNACGGEYFPLPQEKRVVDKINIRKTVLRFAHMMPGGGGAPPVDEAGPGENEGARADAAEPAKTRRTLIDPGKNRRRKAFDARAGAAGNNERIERRAIRNRMMRTDDDAA